MLIEWCDRNEGVVQALGLPSHVTGAGHGRAQSGAGSSVQQQTESAPRREERGGRREASDMALTLLAQPPFAATLLANADVSVQQVAAQLDQALQEGQSSAQAVSTVHALLVNHANRLAAESAAAAGQGGGVDIGLSLSPTLSPMPHGHGPGSPTSGLVRGLSGLTMDKGSALSLSLASKRNNSSHSDLARLATANLAAATLARIPSILSLGPSAVASGVAVPAKSSKAPTLPIPYSNPSPFLGASMPHPRAPTGRNIATGRSLTGLSPSVGAFPAAGEPMGPPPVSSVLSALQGLQVSSPQHGGVSAGVGASARPVPGARTGRTPQVQGASDSAPFKTIRPRSRSVHQRVPAQAVALAEEGGGLAMDVEFSSREGSPAAGAYFPAEPRGAGIPGQGSSAATAQAGGWSASLSVSAAPPLVGGRQACLQLGHTKAFITQP
jgi:hypothetical protein